MSCLRWMALSLVMVLSARVGLCEENLSPAKPPRASRSLMNSLRSVSPASKNATEKTSDKPVVSEAPVSNKPDRIPSLDEMILFQPRKSGDWTPDQLKYTDVEFELVDGTSLHAWYCPAETPRAVVLYCHGNAGNIAWMADFFEFLRTRHKLSVLAFDYRGYGKSQGTPTVEGVLADGRAARAKVAELAGVPSTEVVVWGRSMGGAVAVQLASEERPRGLILECTFDSFKTVAQHHAPRWAFLVPEDRLASVRRIPEVQCPLFQAHGAADRVVPFASGKTLYEAANEPKFFYTLRNADHNTRSPDKLYDTIDQFLDQQCPKRPALETQLRKWSGQRSTPGCEPRRNP